MLTEEARKKYDREREFAFKCRLSILITTSVFWLFVLWAVAG